MVARKTDMPFLSSTIRIIFHILSAYFPATYNKRSQAWEMFPRAPYGPRPKITPILASF
jgi:hypothetical protein